MGVFCFRQVKTESQTVQKCSFCDSENEKRNRKTSTIYLLRFRISKQFSKLSPFDYPSLSLPKTYREHGVADTRFPRYPLFFFFRNRKSTLLNVFMIPFFPFCEFYFRRLFPYQIFKQLNLMLSLFSFLG